MKKKVSPRRTNLKSRWLSRHSLIQEKNLNLAHPVVKASYLWSILSDQLLDILGPHVHHQWFKSVHPMVISQNVLILEVPNHFCAQWIHSHYHELIDVLLSVQNKNLSSFFVSQTERVGSQERQGLLLKSTASEINGKSEDQDSCH